MKKNVAIIIQKLTGGGAEKVAANLSISLSEKYNVFLYVFNTDNITYEYRGKLTRIDKKSGKNKIEKVLNVSRRVKIIKQLKKQDNIDVSISLLHFANLVNVMSKKKDKTIISIRNNISDANLLKFEMNCIKKAVKKANKVVALSKAIENQLNSLYGENEKTLTIYNSIPKKAQKADSFENIYGDYIVTMGRLTKQKGQWHLVKAFSIVHEKLPNLKLVILGEGPYFDNLKKLINDMGLTENIVLYGYSSNPHDFVSSSKAFIFPSVFEGLGNSIVESLALGKCIISTDCNYGPRELLATDKDTVHSDKYSLCEYGVLVPHVTAEPDWSLNIDNDEKILAQAIIKVISNPPIIENYEEKAKIRAMDFTQDIIISQWENLIDEI